MFARGVPKAKEQEQEQPGAKEKPKLKYFCNFPGCGYSSVSRDQLCAHWFHIHRYPGSNFCRECGNSVADNYPWRTFLGACPRVRHITSPSKLKRLREKTAQDQQK